MIYFQLSISIKIRSVIKSKRKIYFQVCFEDFLRIFTSRRVSWARFCPACCPCSQVDARQIERRRATACAPATARPQNAPSRLRCWWRLVSSWRTPWPRWCSRGEECPLPPPPARRGAAAPQPQSRSVKSSNIRNLNLCCLTNVKMSFQYLIINNYTQYFWYLTSGSWNSNIENPGLYISDDNYLFNLIEQVEQISMLYFKMKRSFNLLLLKITDL